MWIWSKLISPYWESAQKNTHLRANDDRCHKHLLTCYKVKYMIHRSIVRSSASFEWICALVSQDRILPWNITIIQTTTELLPNAPFLQCLLLFSKCGRLLFHLVTINKSMTRSAWQYRSKANCTCRGVIKNGRHPTPLRPQFLETELFIPIKLGQCILIRFKSRIFYGAYRRVWDYECAKLKLINQSN